MFLNLRTTFFLVTLLGSSCTPPLELEDKDLGTPGVDWEELEKDARNYSRELAPIWSLKKNDAEPLGMWPAASRISTLPSGTSQTSSSPQKMQRASLDPSILGDQDLLGLALTRAIQEPRYFRGGVLGRFEHAKMFLVPKKKIQTEFETYLMTVHFISSSGCFMTSRIKLERLLQVTCRDGRTLVVWSSQDEEALQLISRQFDAQGYEISVQSRKKVRISKMQVLESPGVVLKDPSQEF